MQPINPCPTCGSDIEVDSTGISEISGKCVEGLYLSCKNKECYIRLELTLDFTNLEYEYDEFVLVDEMIRLWNKLKKVKR